MYKIQAIYDGVNFKPTQLIPVKEPYEVVITFFEPLKVSLLPHDKDWANQFGIINKELHEILGCNICKMFHIGSTAIKNIHAKPILDVAIIVNNFQLLNVVGMDIAGYSYCGERAPGRYLFVRHKQYGSISLQHIHCYQKNDDELLPTVLFCRYLNEYPEYAKQYNDLKLELLSKHSNDRWLYSSGKSEFIQMILRLARNKYCCE
ncbi:MAG: GrpB family protein [Defluviitaleaceae bacterium]|nr:GrpB family protein [Defluviitaleaceae bacterium]